jgi:hypothetical protein
LRHAVGIGRRLAGALKMTFMRRSYSARVEFVIFIRPEVWLLECEEEGVESEVFSLSHTESDSLAAVSCSS